MANAGAAEIQAAMQLHGQGRIVEAERAYRAILEQQPDEPNASHMLGVMLYQRGEFAEAEPHLKASLKFADQVPQWHSNYAVFCRAARRLDEAEKHLRRALELVPGAPEMWDNLGLVLGDQGRHAEAQRAFEMSKRVAPGYVLADHHWAQNLWNRGLAVEAIRQWEAVLKVQPNFADAHGSLCFALNKVGQTAVALGHGLRAVELDPNSPDAHVALAITYGHQGKWAAGVEELNKSLSLAPQYLPALVNLGWLLERSYRHDEAADASRAALRIDPANVQAMINLSTTLTSLGDYEEAIEWLRGALEIEPDHFAARSNLLRAMMYDPKLSRQQIFEEHVKYGKRLEAKTGGRRLAHLNERDPDRKLKIAYFSPDFWRHPVASFIEPALRSHDRERFVVSCYSAGRTADATTQRLRGLVDKWYNVQDLGDEAILETIQQNREDILIDLAGHTADNRLTALAFKPAPVQINYLGHVDTSGVAAMDYRMTDSLVDPPGSEAFYTEKLLRLPCFFCYEAPREAAAVGELPAERNGFVTFGSLNQAIKFNERVLKLWAELLKRVPGSRLLLMAATSGRGTARIRETFEGFGISSDRLTLLPRQFYEAYFDSYNRIDIGLDPFPASGHTTTCDALWMGVPVITKPGESYVSRLSMDVLSQLGLPELIAGDEEQYLQRAVELAGDRTRLRELRSTLRQRMQESILMNAAEFTRNLESAYRQVWRSYCESPA